MGRAGKMFVVACVGIGLLPGAMGAAAQMAPLKDQIAQHEQLMSFARAGNSSRDEAMQLVILSTLYRQAGDLQKALDYATRALSIDQKTGNEVGQALALNAMGRIDSDLGQEDKALPLFNQALPLWRKLGFKPAEGDTLNNIGRVYDNLGERDEALKYLNQALDILRANAAPPGKGQTLGIIVRNLGQVRAMKEMSDAIPNWKEAGRAFEASTLDNLGRTYSDMGQGQKGLEFFNQALPVWHEVGEQGGEALTLTNMGTTYADLGEKQNSLEYYNRALETWRKIGNRQGEAMTLNSMGRLYRDLGEQQTALDYYNQALPIWREVGTRNGEGMALNDIGRAYADMGQPQKALEYSAQALPIWHETGARRGEAATLNNMGRDYTDLKEPDKALDTDLQALSIWREVKDRRGEALALMSIGWAYAANKEMEKALASELAALSLAKAVGDPEIEGGMETSLMLGFREQHLPNEAIFFGLEAVSSYQQIRKNISGMEKDLQAGFAQSKSRAYRVLAELLVQAGRLGEAEEILDLLKEAELQDIVRGAPADAAAKVQPFKLTPTQQKAESALADLEKKAQAFEDVNVEYAVLQAKAARTSEEEARLKALTVTITQETTEVQGIFTNTFSAELAEKPGSAVGEESTQSYLQNTLAKLGPRVMGIRLLLGEDHAYAIVVTATTRKEVELKATPAALREQALTALKTMTSRTADPRSQLEHLYAMVVAPLEDELKALETPADPQGRAPTLLWSLDDVMRYLPMAALYDGQHYLVERFNNVLFTPESYGHMTDSPLLNGAKPSVLAMGLSKSYGGLPALPGVMPELEAVAHDPASPDSHGPMEGKLLPNEQFTLAALKTELGASNPFSVIHIASHFVVEAGSGQEPYLMMGGENSGDSKGFEWNLSDMENSSIAFKGTRLLSLSACSTAKEYTSRNGVEMDSLGMVAQQKQAEAVLATMWDVNDASTSRLMGDFYTRWVNAPASGKAEALRQAQLVFVRGAAGSGSVAAATGRGFQAEGNVATAQQDLGYSHPYYWAPFVLIGNYQ